jgi:hypothetical protein
MSNQELLERIIQLEKENAELKRTSGIVKCKGVTGKGIACRNKAIPGEECCRLHHDRPTKIKKDPPKERITKTKKTARIHPRHNHSIGEKPLVLCPLCESHGDVLDPCMLESTYKIVEARRLWCEEEDDGSLPELSQDFL